MDPQVARWYQRALELEEAGDQSLAAEIHECGGAVTVGLLEGAQWRRCECPGVVPHVPDPLDRLRLHGLEELIPLAMVGAYTGTRYAGGRAE